MAIERRLDGGFFIIKRPSHNAFICIVVEIPAFDEFSALARGFIEEIDENHDKCSFSSSSIIEYNDFAISCRAPPWR